MRLGMLITLGQIAKRGARALAAKAAPVEVAALRSRLAVTAETVAALRPSAETAAGWATSARDLEAASVAADFWDFPDAARRTLADLARAKENAARVAEWDALLGDAETALAALRGGGGGAADGEERAYYLEVCDEALAALDASASVWNPNRFKIPST